VLKEFIDFLTLLIGEEGAKTPVGVRDETPQVLQRRGGSPERPRTARFLSANQQPNLTQPINKTA
jgi:hypothetical protein